MDEEPAPALTLAKYIALSAAAAESCERLAAAETDATAAGIMRMRAGFLRAEAEALQMTDDELASARRAEEEATKNPSSQSQLRLHAVESECRRRIRLTALRKRGRSAGSYSAERV